VETFSDSVEYMEETVTSSRGIPLGLSGMLEPDDFLTLLGRSTTMRKKVAARLMLVVKEVFSHSDCRDR
jgi:hypothetical protein